MFIAFLELWSVWFWIALVTPLVLLTFTVEREYSEASLGLVVIFVALWLAFGPRELIHWLTQNTGRVLEALAAYIVIGVIWGIAKWWLFLRKIFLLFREAERRYEKVKASYEQRLSAWSVNGLEGRKGVAPPRLQTFKDFLREEGADFDRLRRITLPPDPAENKGRIIFWMSYWPVSLGWFLAHAPITRLYRWLYESLGELFSKMSRAVFAKVDFDKVNRNKDEI